MRNFYLIILSIHILKLEDSGCDICLLENPLNLNYNIWRVIRWQRWSWMEAFQKLKLCNVPRSPDAITVAICQIHHMKLDKRIHTRNKSQTQMQEPSEQSVMVGKPKAIDMSHRLIHWVSLLSTISIGEGGETKAA
jgi:hypothetical protein